MDMMQIALLQDDKDVQPKLFMVTVEWPTKIRESNVGGSNY
jgi:hypothetical protein